MLEEERLIALRHPVTGVPRHVADDIRLGLDDAAAGHACSHPPHQ